MTKTRLDENLTRCPARHIGVFGDLGLDAYWYANMTRLFLTREMPRFDWPVVREVYTPSAEPAPPNSSKSTAASGLRVSALGLTVIGLTGESGGRLADLADVAIRVPAAQTDRVQELHVQCYHALCEVLEGEFFGCEA